VSFHIDRIISGTEEQVKNKFSYTWRMLSVSLLAAVQFTSCQIVTRDADLHALTYSASVPSESVFWGLVASSTSGGGTEENQDAQEWKEHFDIDGRKLSDTGRSEYFILVPGFQIILESKKEKLTITVLDETKEINGIKTRVVEEREEKKGELFEISKNFFAVDQETGDVFYFGEEVDFYEEGEIVDHSGAWMAYENGNRPGLMMPGTPAVGMKYYQELAPGVAMDRAEVISISETFATPVGEFTNCLRTEESSKIKKLLFFTPKEYKTYAPGIGLIQDESMKLISYGYVENAGHPKK
jgi:hypothetical protein